MLRPEVQHITLLYGENSWGFSLQRHLGVNGVYTTRNVGRLILIYETGTNTTYQTSRAVLAVHKTSVSGIGEVISHLPLSPSLFPHPSPPPPPTHTQLILPRKENGLTMTDSSNSVDMLKVGLEENDRLAECPIGLLLTVTIRPIFTGTITFHPLLKPLCSFVFWTGHYVPLFKGTFCSGKTIQIFDF